MRGFPKIFCTKQDYLNVLSDPELAEEGKARLRSLADDRFIWSDSGKVFTLSEIPEDATQEEKDEIAAAARTIPVFFAANYSFGIALLIECAKMAAKALPDAEIEIIETHHDRKLDAPSGTALAIADAICDVRPELYTHCGRNGFGKRAREEIGIHAVRIGNVVGTHEVLLSTGTQTLTLRHEAHDRRLFAEGALMAASFLADLPRETHGLYGMRDLL